MPPIIQTRILILFILATTIRVVRPIPRWPRLHPWAGIAGITSRLRLRTPARILGLNLCFGAFLLEHFFKRVTGIPDVLSQELASCGSIAGPAQLENLVMLFICPLQAGS